MLAVSLVFGTFLTVLFFIVGIIGGWVAREYLMNYRDLSRLHPEMFDSQGNLVADEVVSLKIEPGFYDEFMQEYEGLFEEDEDEN